MSKFLLVIVFVFFVLSTSAQQKIIPEKYDSAVALQTPYSTIYTHLYNLQKDSYKPEISATTIPGNGSLKEKRDYAIKIKKVLDGKGIIIDMNSLPDEANFKDSLSKKNIFYLSNQERLIYLEKIEDSWYYSRTTIANINELYTQVYPSWAVFIDNFFTSNFSNSKFLGIMQWQWVAFLFLLVASFVIYFLAKLLGLFIFRNFFKRLFKSLPDEKIVNKLLKSFGLVIVFWFIISLIPSLKLPLNAVSFLITVSKIIFISFLTLFFSNLFKMFLFYLEKAADKTKTKLDNQLLPLLSKIVKLLIYFIGFLYILSTLNINVTAMLAGLSIGGLALALASKDTVQNVIGSLNIFLDRPFEIDDYILVDGVEGTVEEVGLRATRIRTLNQSLAYIPNGLLSNMTIDNFGMRVYRRWITTLGLEYDTPPEKIKLFIDNVFQIVTKHKDTLENKSLVKFNNMGASTLDIYVSIFFKVDTFEEDLNCKQELLLDILAMANEIGVSFAFPSRTLYINKD